MYAWTLVILWKVWYIPTSDISSNILQIPEYRFAKFYHKYFLKGKFVTAAQRSLTPLQYFGAVREFCAIVLSLAQLHLNIKSHFCYFSVVLSWGMTDSALHHSVVGGKEISYPLYWSVNFSSDWAHISILPESRSNWLLYIIYGFEIKYSKR